MLYKNIHFIFRIDVLCVTKVGIISRLSKSCPFT